MNDDYADFLLRYTRSKEQVQQVLDEMEAAGLICRCLDRETGLPMMRNGQPVYVAASYPDAMGPDNEQ